MQVKEFVIDLFCGAGGTSEGVFLSDAPSIVTACVNHDAMAIESHRKNHPYAKHFIEDIRNPEVVFFLKLRVNALRKLYPNCIITIWASLECTNHSKAKGGLSREEDSRTLANHLYMYIDELNPDYLMIENVMEFKDWGPLRIKEDKKNSKRNKYSALLLNPKSNVKKVKFHMVPVQERKGEDYEIWKNETIARGFSFDWRKINAADLGAHTSRSRYFAQFAKGQLPITWPQQTHAKKPEPKSGLKKWRAVREVLDFSVIGRSIFNRKKALVDNTLRRIYAGLVKFVANGNDSFIEKEFANKEKGKVISINGAAGHVTTIPSQFLLKYNSVNKKTGKHVPPSLEDPAPTVSTQGRLGIVEPEFDFLTGYYSTGGSQVNSTDDPCPTVSTKDRFNQISVFLSHYYNGGGQISSVNEPHPTVTGVPKSRLNYIYFVDQQYGKSKPKGIDTPSNTVPVNPKDALVEATQWILNPSFANKGNGTDQPCPVVIARQDKAPLQLIVCESSQRFAIPIYEDDTEMMIKIKQFMAYYGITDIKMRMLVIEELLRIQGFPSDYELVGTQTEKKKFIGNSVEVTTAKKLFEAHYDALHGHLIEKQQVA